MKKSNKKGFTIVELVIVIAVIAILAAVLIPTFSNVVEKANESKDMQAARIAYENYLADHAQEGTDSINLCISSGSHFYHVVAGQFKTEVPVHGDNDGGCMKNTAQEGTTAVYAFKHLKVQNEYLVAVTTVSGTTSHTHS